MLRDIRYAVRLIRRSPSFSITVVLTLALGVGLNTAIFSIVNGVLLRPLPYTDPSDLVTGMSLSSEASSDWRHRTMALVDIALYDFSVAPLLLAGDETVRLRQATVSSNFLSVLGVPPVMGRNFRAADSEPGAEPVTILTYRTWEQNFGARSDIIGSLAPFEPLPRRVVGVLPPGFVFPMGLAASTHEVRMLTPISMPARAGYTFNAVGRLKSGATLAEARAEELAIVPRTVPPNGAPVGSNLISVSEALLGGSRPSLLLLFGAVGLLLLIACANVGNLLFARGVASRQEFAVRFALGASRRELGRLIVIQSCTLSLAGGLLGVLFTYWTFDALKSFVPPQLPRAADVGIDIRVLGFAFFLSLISGATLALFPAWHLSRGGFRSALYTHDRATLPGQRGRLVVLASQVALAVVLLSGAALFVQSFVRLLGTDLGFAPQRVLTLQLTTLQSRYSTLEQQRTFLRGTLDRLGTVSGVASVGAVELLPVTRARRGGQVVAVGKGESEPVDAEPRVVSESYFEAMGIDVLLGRPLNRQDGSTAPHVALVNETLARRLWPGGNPIGQHIRYEKEGLLEVVGVVRDVRGYAVDTRPEPQIYIPYSQSWLVPQRLVIRTHGSPEALASAVRRELRVLDARAAAENIQPLSAHVAASIAQPRFLAWLLGIFGGSGLLLATVGIAGVVAYAVSQRTREVGIRIALGASKLDVIRAVVGPSVGAVAVGLMVGVGVAAASGRLARAFLFEIDPHNPLTLSLVVVVLGGAAVGAAYHPARRATLIDPLLALRAD
jgi:putative ABC transport system permease protein